MYLYLFTVLKKLDFPGGTVDKNPSAKKKKKKNPPANKGDMGSIPGPGSFHTPRSN